MEQVGPTNSQQNELKKWCCTQRLESLQRWTPFLGPPFVDPLFSGNPLVVLIGFGDLTSETPHIRGSAPSSPPSPRSDWLRGFSVAETSAWGARFWGRFGVHPSFGAQKYGHGLVKTQIGWPPLNIRFNPTTKIGSS